MESRLQENEFLATSFSNDYVLLLLLMNFCNDDVYFIAVVRGLSYFPFSHHLQIEAHISQKK